MAEAKVSTKSKNRKRSAIKAQRAALRKRVFNSRRKVTMKDAVRDFSKLIGAKDAAGSRASLPALYQAIDKAAKSGTIKKNTAARRKSRFTKQLAAIV